MMRDFKTIYRILKVLADTMDEGELDLRLLDPERLGVSENHRNALLAMLLDEGYIEDVHAPRYADRKDRPVYLMNPTITLKGLEYLEENSMMRKAADLAKDIIGAAL